MSITIETAKSYLAAGLSVLPAVKARKCPFVGRWKTWQERLPTPVEVSAWFANPHDAVCLVCGKVSGNLEIIDFDHKGELFPKWAEAVPQELFDRLVIEQTPSGGFHVAYRCSGEVCGNLKLAQGIREEGKLVTLIETRGNGGLFLCSPTEGYVLKHGDFTRLPVLSAEERTSLLEAAYALNEKAVEEKDGSAGVALPDDSQFSERPGDDFNVRGDVRELLMHHGWTPVRVDNGNEYFRRPGKSGSGWSASLKDRVFYVFSSNAAPFESNQAYSPFNVYALLEHQGDYTGAAKHLLECGYGAVRKHEGVNLSAFLKKPESDAKSILSLEELMAKYPKMRPVLIHGLLRIGETMNIIAPPKTGKSWLVTDLAASVACGLPWFGFPCEQGKVLILDNELHPETSAQRIPKVIDARGYSMNIVKRNLFVENQRGRLNSIFDLRSRLEEIKAFGFKLVIVDAFYRAMPGGMDENDNAKMASVYNTIDSYAAHLDCAFVLIHHTSKGNQAMKSVTDIGAGAGAQSRATDTHLVLRPHEERGVVVMDSVVRSFPPVDPVCLRWNFPVWNYDASLDPESLDGKLDEPVKRQEQPDIADQAVEAAELIEKPIQRTEFVAVLQMKLKVSRNRAREIIDCAKSLGIVAEEYFVDPDNRTRHAKMLRRNPVAG